MQEVFRSEEKFNSHSEYTTQLIFACLFTTPFNHSAAEFEIKKMNKRPGYIDFVIQEKLDTSNPNKQLKVILLEFKNKQLQYLNLKGASLQDKAELLSSLTLAQVLELKVVPYDSFHPDMAIKEICSQTNMQINEYRKSLKQQWGKNFIYLCYVVMSVGSRKIIISVVKE